MSKTYQQHHLIIGICFETMVFDIVDVFRVFGKLLRFHGIEDTRA